MFIFINYFMKRWLEDCRVVNYLMAYLLRKSKMESQESTFTCLSCRVGFPTSEGQRQHYKTDWHRYNLKRKIAGMVPVTAENFRERSAAAQKEQEQEQQKQVSPKRGIL